jgi:hypothetical protein
MAHANASEGENEGKERGSRVMMLASERQRVSKVLDLWASIKVRHWSVKKRRFAPQERGGAIFDFCFSIFD